MTPPLLVKAAARGAGFTLIELAIALVIVALVAGGGLMAWSAQMEIQREKEARALLALAKEALLGFMQTHGRLPCPANGDSGNEAGTAGSCTHGGGAVVTAELAAGFLPAATLGIANDPRGFLLDPRPGGDRRIRYAVLRRNAGDQALTTANAVSLAYLAGSAWLTVCSGTNLGGGPGCGGLPGHRLADAAVVLWAPGMNGAGGGADEAENYDNDRFFVAHERRRSGAAGGEFDDIVDWLAPGLIAAHLIQAGRLP